MANATVSQPTSTRPIQRRRKPTAEAILRTYNAELHRGRRGAYRRTGDLLGVSDETVRRIVHKAEQPKEPPAEDDTLTYVPPPGAYATPQPSPQLCIVNKVTPQQEPQATPAECDALMSSASSDVARMPQSPVATRHTFEQSVASIEGLETPQPERGPASPTSPPDDGPREPLPDAPKEPLPPEPDPDIGPVVVPPASPESPMIVVRQVVRVPIEPRRSGVVAWCVEHEAIAKQLTAVALFLVLVALTWLG